MPNAAQTAGAYLRPRDVAERLDVKVDTVLAWIHAGTLAAANCAERAGKRPRWRIATADVDAFLRGRAAQPVVRAKRPRARKDSTTREYF